MAATARQKVAHARFICFFAILVLFSCVFGCSSARYRGAFVTLSHSLSSRNSLQLPLECYVHAMGRNRASCRRSIATAGATAAVQDTTGAEAEEEEEKELRLLTWMEVEACIERDIAKVGTAAVIVPLGATEQHGPNGLIGTDHMTAEAVARGVSEATGALLAPCINYGMSFHHGSFPGTVTLSPATFVGVVRDVASSLSKTGFTHVLFINGHGGNVGPTYKAFADLAAEEQRRQEGSETEVAVTAAPTETESEEATAGGPGRGGGGSSNDDDGGNIDSSSASRARLKLISWYAGRESSALAKELYGAEVGQHATPDEVAMTQHLFPRSIKAGVELDPAAIQVARDLGGMTKRAKDEETGLSVMDTEDFRRRFPDGRMFSNPGLATPEHGGRLLDAAVRDATEALGKFLSGVDLVEEAEAAAKRAAAAEAAAAEAAAAATGEGPPLKQNPRWGSDKPPRARSGRNGKGRGGRADKSGGAESRVVGGGGVVGVAAEGKKVGAAGPAAVVAWGNGDSKTSAEERKLLGLKPAEGKGERRKTQQSRNCR